MYDNASLTLNLGKLFRIFTRQEPEEKNSNNSLTLNLEKLFTRQETEEEHSNTFRMIAWLEEHPSYWSVPISSRKRRPIRRNREIVRI